MKKNQSGEKEIRQLKETPDMIVMSPEEYEEARLRKAMNMSDLEKFKLFTRMLRISAMLRRAVITHKR